MNDKNRNISIFLALLVDGKIKYQKKSGKLDCAEFYDSNSEMVATYFSNLGWHMMSTEAEMVRTIKCAVWILPYQKSGFKEIAW